MEKLKRQDNTMERKVTFKNLNDFIENNKKILVCKEQISDKVLAEKLYGKDYFLYNLVDDVKDDLGKEIKSVIYLDDENNIASFPIELDFLEKIDGYTNMDEWDKMKKLEQDLKKLGFHNTGGRNSIENDMLLDIENALN